MSAATPPLGLVVIGAGGRMATNLLRLLPEFPSLRLRAALCRPGNRAQGRDSGELAGLPATGVPVTADLAAALEGARLALDFSAATAAAGHLRQCAAAGVPLLLGTTGHEPGITGFVEAAAARIPILVAPNTSLGATVLLGLVRQAAAALGEGFAVSIRDLHHSGKRDAPSGTALALGTAVQEGSLGGQRPVEYVSVREGDAVGRHDAEFRAAGESLHLSHVATDRTVFARGALQAGLWLVRQPPGRYEMAHVIAKK